MGFGGWPSTAMRLMLILSWNCQGMARPLTVQILRGLCITHRPSIVFLMETKNKSGKLDRVRRRLQFSHKCYVDPEGLSGGLALWWTDEVDIEVRLKSKHFFRCVVGANGLGQN